MLEQEFILAKGFSELNPKSGLQIIKGITRGVWLVVDYDTKRTLLKGGFDNAYSHYVSSC